MKLGSRLKQIIDERKMTVSQLARQADVPAQTIYALINRDSNKADMEIMNKLLAALDMDFFSFMGGKAEEKETGSVEIPAGAPEGMAAVYVDKEIYDKAAAMAAGEGIEDPEVLTRIFNEYFSLGFGYRQRSFASIISDHAPRRRRSGDMDSFLL